MYAAFLSAPFFRRLRARRYGMTGEEEKEGLGAADESGVKTPAKPAAKKVAKKPSAKARLAAATAAAAALPEKKPTRKKYARAVAMDDDDL